MNTKTCSDCKINKPLSEFSKNKNGLFGLRSNCKRCNKKYSENYYKINKKSLSAKSKKYRRKNRSSISERHSTLYKNYRIQFLEMYGNRCSCCGEKNYEFLTIEHKLGQKGIKRQTSSKAYREAIKIHNPELYEILCMNCNHAKGRYGHCPHSEIKGENHVQIS